jgi:uncharacterized repeat protein (TIGR01451 family)
VTTGLSSAVTVSNAGDVSSVNDSGSSTIPAPPDLTVSSSHTGAFSQGQIGAIYSLTVTNSGSSSTSGTVTVVNTLPAGLTPTAASGSGWTCGIAAQVVTCTRVDALGGGSSYPSISATVSVSSAAATPLVNSVTVAGGGQGETSNDSAIDSTAISPQAPDLTLTLTHAGTVGQGQTTVTYTGVATNSGGGPTTAPVTFTATFASGLTVASASGIGWTCTVAGPAVSCTRSDALAGGAAFPAVTITASASTSAGSPLTNTATIFGGGQTNTANDTATDMTTVTQSAPDLAVSVSHTGTLTQGDSATWAAGRPTHPLH